MLYYSMIIRVPKLDDLHTTLIGYPEEGGSLLEKPSSVSLKGRTFAMNSPMKYGFLDFERDDNNYKAFTGFIAEKESIFTGLSEFFRDSLFARPDLNMGGYFHFTDRKGTGYIIDKHKNAILAIYSDTEELESGKIFPSRYVVIGTSGATLRSFDQNSTKTFCDEMRWYQDIVNLYIDSIYSLYKKRNPKYFYDPLKRIILAPSFIS
jgi:hypothetical protein